MSLKDFQLIGISHFTAQVGEREQFAIDKSALPQAYGDLRERGIENAVILSTCNRTEIYGVSQRQAALEGFFRDRYPTLYEQTSARSYRLFGEEAIRHLLRVASGLESQVIGEPEILGQVKEAWKFSQGLSGHSSFLAHLFQSAIGTGKRVRTDTRLGHGAVSIGSLAVRLAFEASHSLRDHSVAVLGTGEMGERIIRELDAYNLSKLYVVSHTLDYARELTQKTSGIPLAITSLPKILPKLEILFTASAAPHPVLDPGAFTQRHVTQPLVIVDLGMPRNVHPEVQHMGHIELHDLDGLQNLSEDHRQARASALPQAEAILEEECRSFRIAWEQRQAVPFIRALKDYAEEIRLSQLEWALPKLGELSSQQREVLERFSQRLVNQMLNSQLGRLRDVANDQQALHETAELIGFEKHLSKFLESAALPKARVANSNIP